MCCFDVCYSCVIQVLYYHVLFFFVYGLLKMCLIVLYIKISLSIVLFRRVTKQTRVIDSNIIFIDSMPLNFIDSVSNKGYIISLTANECRTGRDITEIYLIQLFFFSLGVKKRECEETEM